MKISFIIPNYNSDNILVKNLPRVLANGADEIIIVDDGSTDRSDEKIKNQISKIKNTEKKLKILENTKNLGFSSTVNRGVKEASGDVVVLLNTDVLPEPDFLAPLIGHFSDPLVFAVGCMDKSIEEEKVIFRGRGLAKWSRGFLVHWRGEVDKTDTFWVSCGSGAFRKDLWLKLGGLDEIYNPFYWEDIDLSYRAKKAGYKLVFEPKSVVIHKHEEGVIKQKFSPLMIKTIVYRNQFIFSWKYLENWREWFVHFLWLPFHFTKALINADLAFLLGFLGALKRTPQLKRHSAF